jgi:lysophospholipase L1-like esterase
MNLEKNGFSDNPFMIGYDTRIFEGDEELGFKFPEGKVITSKGFRKFNELITELKFEDTILVNIGDSSTSGWDSDSVSKEEKDKNAPFFKYKTYSDMLEEKFKVINAGVPGYTSLQAKIYLSKILKYVSKTNLRVDFVTIYLGNNDSTFNVQEDKVRLQAKIPSDNNSQGYRVTLEDFKKNIQEIINLCKEYGAKPIIILPLQNLNWEPGIRSKKYKQEFEEALRKMPDNIVKTSLLKAKEYYKNNKLEEARESDFVIPRIKKDYVEGLKEIAEINSISLIDIQNQITSNEFFIDYCHPSEKSNDIISKEIIRNLEIKTKKELKKYDESINLPDDTYTLF